MVFKMNYGRSTTGEGAKSLGVTTDNASNFCSCNSQPCICKSRVGLPEAVNPADLREAVAKYLFELTNPRDWEQVGSLTRQSWIDYADQLLVLLRQHGVVRLDENQELPRNPFADRPSPPMIVFDAGRHEQAVFDRECLAARAGYAKAQEDMAGFRRVREL